MKGRLNMKKKKNNKMKMTIAAGLLITPAIVAQAGVVQASGEVTAESITQLVKNLSEASTIADIESAETLYDNYVKTNDPLAGVAEKLTYLLGYQEILQQVKDLKVKITNEIVTPSASIEKDLNEVKTALEDIETQFDGLTPVTNEELFTNLTDYNLSGELFVEKHITPALLTSVTDAEKNVAAINNFIKDFITPILEEENKEVIDAVQYKLDVGAAMTEYAKLVESVKKLATVLFADDTESITVKKALDNAQLYLTGAKAVEDKITKLKSVTITHKNIESSLNSINDAYAKLTKIPKALVENYDDIKEYNEVLEVNSEIKELPDLGISTQEFRIQLATVELKFKNVEEDMKLLVPLAAKLTEYRTIIDKVIAVEREIEKISTTTITTTLPVAQTAFKTLSSTDKKYMLPDIAQELKDWESSSTTATKVEKQINDIPLDGLNTLDDKALTDAKKVSAITNFISKARLAQSGYAAVVAADEKNDIKQVPLISNRARLEGLLPLIDTANQIISLKSASKTYADDLTAASTALASWNNSKVIEEDKAKIEKLKVYLTGHLKALEDEKKAAEKIEKDIIELKEAKSISLSALTATKEAYNALTTNGKGLVRNFADLKALETLYKEALNVVKLINELDTEARDFAKKTVSAQTAYEKLTLASKEVVDNKKKLDELLPFAQVMNDIDAIRATVKDFKAQLEAATAKYKTLATTNPVKPEDPKKDYVAAATYRLVTEYGPKLAAHQGTADRAKAMEDKIEALKSKSGQIFMNDLKIVSDEYKKLDSTIKRNVGNAKTLTDLERDYKATLKVIDQIEKLPSNTEKTFASKVAAAQKAYERLTEKQRNDVFNYSTKLKPVLKAADLISRIDKLRIGSKTYQQEVAAIRAEYGALSTTEQTLVYNITKLIDAEKSMSKAEEIIKLIDLAIPTAEDYIKKLIAARDAYDALPKIEQKLVTNYKELQTRERAVKPVLKLDNDIVALDPANAKTFISKFKSAQKAYEKLKMADRGLLINLDLLTGEKTTLYNVINAISSIKNSSKTFVADTKNARSLYDALSADLKAKVSNYAILQGHELNVEGGKTVDAMIQALNASEPKEFIANVKAARAAYKALSSANKKAVTLEAELKAQEKYIKPVETAIKAIDDLSNPSKDLSRQFTTVNKALQKLDDKQMTYVSNMDKYSNLSNVTHTYTMISNLKSSDKYYQGNIEAARTAYDKLSEEEKMKVTNYYKLQEALLDMSEVQKVTSIISSLNPSTSSYFADVEKAQAAYKELPSGSRKQVLNYSILKAAEKDMKAAQKVVKQIDDLDPSLRTYESKAKSAKKAYDKLEATQKQLIYNYNKLQAAIFELGL